MLFVAQTFSRSLSALCKDKTLLGGETKGDGVSSMVRSSGFES